MPDEIYEAYDGTSLETMVQRRTPGLSTEELVDKLMMVGQLIAGVKPYPYQIPFIRRCFEAVLEREAEEITSLMSRQSGKSFSLAFVAATLMVMMPVLSQQFPDDDRFNFYDRRSDSYRNYKDGFWCAIYAPKREQATIIFNRVRTFLRNIKTVALLQELGLTFDTNNGDTFRLSSGSFIKCSTASDQANIEGMTLHLAILEESQDISDEKANKSIGPMLAAVGGTLIKIGTANAKKSHFYNALRRNDRRHNQGGVKNNFVVTWEEAAKYNTFYEQFVRKEIARLGLHSDEFQMNYACVVPETMILTADLRYIPAAHVKAGMSLLGFDETTSKKHAQRHFRRSKVLGVAEVVKPCYSILLDDGTSVTCSHDHQWVVRTAGGRTLWKATETLTTHDRILKPVDVWEELSGRDSGYLAAAFDGEGSIAGGKVEALRFLGSVRPVRLLARFDPDRIGGICRHDSRDEGFLHPKVVALKPVGFKKVLAIETSTRTYIAEGLASHNCKFLLERGLAIPERIFWSRTVTEGTFSDILPAPRRGMHYVAGIDFGKVHDSTVVTVMEVNWDNPRQVIEGYDNENGAFTVELYGKHIADWLELQGDDYEAQYVEIQRFLRRWGVAKITLDYTGVGTALGDRFKAMFDTVDVEFVTYSDDSKDSIGREMLADLRNGMITWPGGPECEERREYRNFKSQMLDLEKDYKNGLLSLHHPDMRGAHDDYPQSCCLAIHAGNVKAFGGEVEESPGFYGRR